MRKDELNTKLDLTYLQNRGITLVALVITIIVMLILIGTIVTVVIKGGLFESAKEATNKTDEAIEEESEFYEYEMEKVFDKTNPVVTIEESDDDLSVKLIANEKIKTPEGWNKINDTTFTKTYQNDGTYTVTVEDLSGNKTETEFTVRSYKEYEYIELAEDNQNFTISTDSLSYRNKIELKINILDKRYQDLLICKDNDNNLAFKIREEMTSLVIHRTSNYSQTFIKNSEFLNKVMTITQTDSKSIYQYDGETSKTPINWANWTSSRFDSTNGKLYLGNIKSKIYYLKIYDINGEIKNELIPVKKKDDGNSYLYDKITCKYYSCKGAEAKND